MCVNLKHLSRERFEIQDDEQRVAARPAIVVRF
jgi:hypothetical protein